MEHRLIDIYKVEYDINIRLMDYDGTILDPIRIKEATKYITTNRNLLDKLNKLYNPERVQIFADTIKATKVYYDVYMQDNGSRENMELYRVVELEEHRTPRLSYSKRKTQRTICFILANHGNEHRIFEELHPECEKNFNIRFYRKLVGVIVA